jgi:hypothetical protein
VQKHEFDNHVLNECEGRPSKEQLDIIVEYNEKNKNKIKQKKEPGGNWNKKVIREGYQRAKGWKDEENMEENKIVEKREKFNEERKENSQSLKYLQKNNYVQGDFQDRRNRTSQLVEGKEGLEKGLESMKVSGLENETEKIETKVVKQSLGFTLSKTKIVDRSNEEEKDAQKGIKENEGFTLNKKKFVDRSAQGEKELKHQDPLSKCTKTALSSAELQKNEPEIDENEKIASERQKECQNQIF